MSRIRFDLNMSYLDLFSIKQCAFHFLGPEAAKMWKDLKGYIMEENKKWLQWGAT